MKGVTQHNAAIRVPANSFGRKVAGATLLSGFLAICFIKPLGEWWKLSLNNSLYSHLPLIPVVSAYLVWMKKGGLPQVACGSIREAAIASAAAAALLITASSHGGITQLALQLAALLLLCLGGVLFLLGRDLLVKTAFPAAFLFLLVPFPAALEMGIERFYQQTSAELSFLLIRASNITVMREGLTFHLPGISLEVAPECSGVRSTLILFITSLVGGHLFLKNNRYRFILSAAVIPLGIIRNAVRITTLANMCVYGSPDLIHSPIHTRGGPIFFLLSLIPLSVLLVLLRSRESKRLLKHAQ